MGRSWGAGGICRTPESPSLGHGPPRRPMSHEQGWVCPLESWPVQLGLCHHPAQLPGAASVHPPALVGESKGLPLGWTSWSDPRGSGQRPCPPFTVGPEELPSTTQLPKAQRLLSGGAGTGAPAWFWAVGSLGCHLPGSLAALALPASRLLSMVAGGPLPLRPQGGVSLLQRF